MAQISANCLLKNIQSETAPLDWTCAAPFLVFISQTLGRSNCLHSIYISLVAIQRQFKIRRRVCIDCTQVHSRSECLWILLSTGWSWNQSSMEFHLVHFSLPTPHLCDCLVYEDAIWPKYALWLTAPLSEGMHYSCGFCLGVQHSTLLPLGLVVCFGFLILAVSEQVQCRPGSNSRVGAQGYWRKGKQTLLSCGPQHCWGASIDRGLTLHIVTLATTGRILPWSPSSSVDSGDDSCQIGGAGDLMRSYSL